MAYELEGTLKEIFETRAVGAKGFTKREFVVTVSRGADDRYPQHVKLTLVKDKCSLLDKFQRGQRVKVHFDLRGSEYQGKYYTDLQAWKIDVSGGTTSEPPDDFPDDLPSEEPGF
jgi:hypothetical protein